LYCRWDDDEESCMPIAQKLVLPQGYGQTTETLAWEGVRAQLEHAKQYWLATNRADGSPHVVPVDGLWVDDVWYYGGSPETVHVQLVRTNPHVTMHLPDPWKVVVVQGEVRVSKPSADLAQRLADLANNKYAEYGIKFEASSYSEPGALHPRRVLAWSSFPKDATRFTFAK
jgi:nitroimidazol reductase NimA-like FMN-containing flavoprotein (pyridoxamine 5'-phosphate oxidase superfamily)